STAPVACGQRRRFGFGSPKVTVRVQTLPGRPDHGEGRVAVVVAGLDPIEKAAGHDRALPVVPVVKPRPIWGGAALHRYGFGFGTLMSTLSASRLPSPVWRTPSIQSWKTSGLPLAFGPGGFGFVLLPRRGEERRAVLADVCVPRRLAVGRCARR